jgi:hypothetical protein
MVKTSIFDLLATATDDELDLMFNEIVLGGYEQGFNERSDVLVAAADGTDLNEIFAEIQQTLALRQRLRNQLVDQFTYNVDTVIETVSIPSDVDFEVATEYGQPKGVRGGQRLVRGYDFQFYDLAVRYTWMFIAEATGAQLRNLNNQAIDADNRLVFNKVLKTIYNPTNLLGIADNNIPVNVKKFYNADGEVPPPWKTNTFLGTHTHYVGSNGATLTFANLTTLEDDMYSHGYGVQTGTKLVLYVNRQEGKVIRGFKVAGGAPYDFIPTEGYGGGVFLPASMGAVAVPVSTIPGQIGTYGPWHVVEDIYFQPGYVIAMASGGVNNLLNPVGIRNHSNPAYQGLKHIPGNSATYPLLDSYYRHGFGTGMRQRGGGFVMQVVASTSYTTPTPYV